MAAWTAARAGHGRVVLITGEAGIGKTRLVTELARRADNAGARTAVGAGVDVGGEAPLAIWQELVPQLARTVPPPPEQADWPAELGRLAPDLAARLGRDAPPPPVSSPELERLRVFDAVLRLVEWAAAGRPVLLVAEDVHRADPASMQLCAHIGRRLAARPVLFVLTRRDKPDRPAADALLADLAGRGVEVAELELGPLSAAELAAVARSVADLTDDAVEQVVRAADGNPLLAVESARALAAGRSAPPQNLRAAVRAATGTLARPARDLVEVLAAAGRELSAAELAAALPLADRDAAEASRPGHRAGHPGGRRAAVPARPARRGGTGRPGRAGPPLRAAGAGDRGGCRRRPTRSPPRWPAICTARAATTWPARAGSGRRGTPGRWARCQRRPGSGPRRCAATRRRWTSGWSWPRRSAGSARTPTSSASGRRPCERLPEERQSVAWNRRGKVLRTVVCNPRASLAAYQRAAELLPADAPRRLRVDILLGAAWCESAAGDPARAAALLDEVASLVADPDDTIVAEMANAELMSLIRLGRFTECEAVAERGGAAARRAGRPDLAFGLWIQTACALSGAGDLAGALRAADAAVAATRGMTVIEVQCLAARAFVLSRLGRHDEALSLAAEQLAKAERMDSPGGRGPGPPRRGADLAGGRPLRRGGAVARRRAGRGRGGEPPGRAAGPGRGAGPVRPPGRGGGRGAPGGPGAGARAATSRGRWCRGWRGCRA